MIINGFSKLSVADIIAVLSFFLIKVTRENKGLQNQGTKDSKD